MLFKNSFTLFGLASKKFRMNFSPLILIVALGTISIVMQHGNAGKLFCISYQDNKPSNWCEMLHHFLFHPETISELEAKISAIQASLGTICNSIDTATTHCCYNPGTLKMFCSSHSTVAGALGIDTSTAGVCDNDAGPCN